MSADWLEASGDHPVSKVGRKGKRDVTREVSWTDFEPWLEHQEQQVSSLPTITEQGGEKALEEETKHDEPAMKDCSERPSLETPPELPPSNLSQSNIEEEPPSLPEYGPPSMMEDDLTSELSLSKDEQLCMNDTTLGNKLLHKEESFQGEAPIPPEGEPPLLTFDESSEELSWEQERAEQEDYTEQVHSSESWYSTDHQMTYMQANEEDLRLREATDSNNVSSSSSKVEYLKLSAEFSTDSRLSNASAKPPPNDDMSHGDDSLELDTSMEQESVFTVSLKKGFRGLGFLLDKERSLAEGIIISTDVC